MEEFKATSYGDLSDKEFAEFLSEIECSDDEMENLRLDADNHIREADEKSLMSEPIAEEPEENVQVEEFYGEDAWRKLNSDALYLNPDEISRKNQAKSTQGIKARSARMREERLTIQREAFNQTLISLSDPIRESELRRLIQILVQEHTRMMDKYAAFINRRLEVLLNPLIPRRIRVCRMLHPESVRVSPGFMYRAKVGDKELSFWATPSIPYYFEQGTEQQILSGDKLEFLKAVDKAVASYYAHEEKRAQREVKYATSLLRARVKTWFDLLKLNPYWYETLFKEVTDENRE